MSSKWAVQWFRSGISRFQPSPRTPNKLSKADGRVGNLLGCKRGDTQSGESKEFYSRYSVGKLPSSITYLILPLSNRLSSLSFMCLAVVVWTLPRLYYHQRPDPIRQRHLDGPTATLASTDKRGQLPHRPAAIGDGNSMAKNSRSSSCQRLFFEKDTFYTTFAWKVQA